MRLKTKDSPRSIGRIRNHYNEVPTVSRISEFNDLVGVFKEGKESLLQECPVITHYFSSEQL